MNNGRIKLEKVTLVSVSGINPNSAHTALVKSMEGIDFEEVVLISHEKPAGMDSRVVWKQCKDDELVSKDPKNTDDYSYFMAYRLCNYIDTDYCLIVHNDAYVIHPEKWDDEFLKYDYIGAPWPALVHYTKEGMNVRVGNGGFSFRSKRLLNILNELSLPFTDDGTSFFYEDGLICVYYRKQIEDAGLRFAPVKLAAKFSHEVDCFESVKKTFGFHNRKNRSIFFPLSAIYWQMRTLLEKLL